MIVRFNRLVGVGMRFVILRFMDGFGGGVVMLVFFVGFDGLGCVCLCFPCC